MEILTPACRAPDDETLFALYALGRADEVSAFGWDDLQIGDFLRQQFDFRQRSYATHFPGAADATVECDGLAAGRMMTDRTGASIVLVDIALHPQFRGKGIGTWLLRRLQAEAEASGRSVELHVEFGSAARRLYERLGFRITGDEGLHHAMVWTPVRELAGSGR